MTMARYPSFYWLQFITVHYHILLKPEFLLQRQGNKYSEQRSLTPHFSLTERLARFLSYNKFNFILKRKRIASCLREIESSSIENGTPKLQQQNKLSIDIELHEIQQCRIHNLMYRTSLVSAKQVESSVFNQPDEFEVKIPHV